MTSQPWIPILLFTVGCSGKSDDSGGGSSGEEQTCTYKGEFSGAATVSIDYDDAEGCSSSPYEDRLGMSFGIVDAQWSVSIEISSGYTPGETKDGIAAALELIDTSVGYDGWRTPSDGCTIDITKVREDSFYDWIVEGKGSCSEAAVPEITDLTGEVQVGDFTFVAPG